MAAGVTDFKNLNVLATSNSGPYFSFPGPILLWGLQCLKLSVLFTGLCFTVINALALTEASLTKYDFMFVDAAIWICFQSINPLTSIALAPTGRSVSFQI
ncbi:hypothetical protein TNIN_485071 [Trichonephila inaurata madagascariensis]|uniref:Uncharacterized protein n=1 Tax=Trichonephila inaurata madagascariensis TaxID=2747483 RepID=A0A8X6X2Z3_9ARAC|nr:hypothetical protein TNIN_485071 [Trichonephila inaurata madagascariensis]